MAASALEPLEIGIFARTYDRPTLGGVLDAAQAQGFRAIHFNYKCAGLGALPEQLDQGTCRMIREEFERRDLVMVAVSATYNTIHPDLERRKAETARAQRVIELCPVLGTELATLCTGSRDPDDMWRAHPGNVQPEAWSDLMQTMEALLESAESASVYLGVEPEAANVISTATKARAMIDQLGSDRIRIVLDPANLVTPETIDRQSEAMAEAFELLASDMLQAHAKDVDEHGHVAAGLGRLDYDRYFALLSAYRVTGPMIIHEVDESDVPRARDFVAAHRATIRPQA